MNNSSYIPDCNDCSLLYHSVFKYLKKEELDRVNYEKECYSYKRGKIIYNEGSRINGFYCINKGIIKIYKTGIDGKGQIIRFAKKGEIIAYRSVLSNEVACTSAKVIEDAVFCFISGDTLVSLIKNNGDFSLELIKLICLELGEANSYITDIAQKTVRARLAEILIQLKNEFGLNSDGVLKISLTREEIANIVGTATESVIRLLSEFKTDSLIELNGRQIKIVDEQELKRIVNLF